ncbi:MAG: glutathione S-transferase [Methylotenera sp.]
MALPILYSYRRCPYAMRARMALKMAEIEVEIREISLRDKPVHMLQVSPKGTVPVLVLQDGTAIEESLEIMLFALQKHALGGNLDTASRALILENDSSFKQALDRYKYPERFPEKSQPECRAQGEVFLQKLENLLEQNNYLLKATPGLVDIAIFPFVRQFAAVDATWFAQCEYPKLRAWLNDWLDSELFRSVMTKHPTFIG